MHSAIFYSGEDRASLDSRLEIVDILLDHGADIDLRDSDMSVALAVAIEQDLLPFVDLLVSRSADISNLDGHGHDIAAFSMDGGHQKSPYALFPDLREYLDNKYPDLVMSAWCEIPSGPGREI